MADTGLPVPTRLPVSLRPIAHYLKTAIEYENRDPVITYWCRLAALQAGLLLDKKSPEAMKALVPLMDWLEREKKVLAHEEAISSEVVATAQLDNHADDLFLWADKEDREARFNKNVVKAFYTAGNLYDVIAVIGELSPESAHHRDYAKWKAAYIHSCLKNGQAPVPGPIENQTPKLQPEAAEPQHEAAGWSQPVPAPRKNTVAAEETGGPESSGSAAAVATLPQSVTTKAQKLCRFASSALDYDDVTSAIDYLHQALSLLQTRQQS